MKIFTIIKQTLKYYSDDDLVTNGAALAFYAIFSIAPGLLVIIGIAGSFYAEADAVKTIQVEFSDYFGEESASMIMKWVDNINNSPSKHSPLFTALLLIFGATGAFSQLQMAFNKIWHTENASSNGVIEYMKARFMAFLLLLIIGILLILTLALDPFVVGLGAYINDFLSNDFPLEDLPITIPTFQYIQLFNRLGTFILYFFAFSWIFKVFSRAKLTWKSIFISAFLTSFLFAFGKWAFGYIISFIRLDFFDAASSIIIFLIWVFYSSQVVFLGAELSKVLYYLDKPSDA